MEHRSGRWVSSHRSLACYSPHSPLFPLTRVFLSPLTHHSPPPKSAKKKKKKWGHVKRRVTEATGLLANLSERTTLTEGEAAFAQVVALVVERILASLANEEWLQEQWRSIDISGDNSVTMNEAIVWLQRRWPKLAQNKYAAKAAFKATCRRHQKKQTLVLAAERRAKMVLVDDLVHHEANAGKAAELATAAAAAAAAAAKKKKKTAAKKTKKKGKDRMHSFFCLYKSEFRSLLRNICFFQKCYGLIQESGDDARRLDFDGVCELLAKLGMSLDLAAQRATFAEIDDNGSGKVYFAEFCDWYAHRSYPLPNDEAGLGEMLVKKTAGDEFAAMIKCYEGRVDVVSCSIVKQLDGSYLAVLMLALRATPPSQEELRAWGELRLGPDLVPARFETLGGIVNDQTESMLARDTTFGL